MATPIRSAFASYKPTIHGARTPAQKKRYEQYRAKQEDPYVAKGYMVFEGFDLSESELAAHRAEQAVFESERIQQLQSIQAANERSELLMAFHSENPTWNEYKPWQTGQAQRAMAREEAYDRRIIEKERKQEEQTKALVKHRSVLKQLNLQPVAGTMKEVAETRRRTEVLRAEKVERDRLLKEAEQIKIDMEEAEWQRRFHSKPIWQSKQKKASYQTVTFSAPRKRTQFEPEVEDQEMFDILNELQQ